MSLSKIRFVVFIACRFFQNKESNYFTSRISNLTILIVMCTTLIPILTTSIMNGFRESITEKHIHRDFHVQITQAYPFNTYQTLINTILKIPTITPHISHIYPFYENQALIQSQHNTFPLTIRAIVPDAYQYDTSFQKHFPLIAGHFELHSKFHIVLGDALAQSLHPTYKEYSQFLEQITQKNYPLIQILLVPDNPYTSSTKTLNIRHLLVSGVFRSGYLQYDSHYAFTTLTTGQSLFNARTKTSGQFQGKVSSIGIKTHTREHTSFIVDELNKQFPDYTIYTWKDANKHLLYALEWEKTLMQVILALMVIISLVITIYINVNIIVFNKKQEIGILRACGVSPETITQIFLLEGFFIGILGTTLGVLMSLFILTSLHPLIHHIETLINTLHSYTQHPNALHTSPQWKFFSGDLGHLQFFLYKIELKDLWLLSSLAIFISTVAAYIPAKHSTEDTIIQNIHHE